MSSVDLARARTDLADAVFLLADTTTTNTEEDDSVTVLYWRTMGCGTTCWGPYALLLTPHYPCWVSSPRQVLRALNVVSFNRNANVFAQIHNPHNKGHVMQAGIPSANILCMAETKLVRKKRGCRRSSNVCSRTT